MNKLLSLICLPVIAISACGGGQPKTSAAVKPEPTVVVVPPKAVIPVQEEINNPDPKVVQVVDQAVVQVTAPAMSPVDIRPMFQADVCDKDSEVVEVVQEPEVIVPQVHILPARFTWTEEETALQVKVLSPDQRANLAEYDFGSDIALDCTYAGKGSLVKHLLVKPEFLAKTTQDGERFRFQETLTLAQDLGKSDYSFSGLTYWLTKQRPSQIRVLDVICEKVG